MGEAEGAETMLTVFGGDWRSERRIRAIEQWTDASKSFS
jgi:hypothetical protein